MVFNAQFPTHLTFQEGTMADMANETTNNMINVTVTRSRPAKTAGLFAFNVTASATASSHAFQQYPNDVQRSSTVEEVLFRPQPLGLGLFCWITNTHTGDCQGVQALPSIEDLLNSSKLNSQHLFEAEILQTK